MYDSEEPQKQFIVSVLITDPQFVDGRSILMSTDMLDEPEIQIPISVSK